MEKIFITDLLGQSIEVTHLEAAIREGLKMVELSKGIQNRHPFISNDSVRVPILKYHRHNLNELLKLKNKMS